MKSPIHYCELAPGGSLLEVLSSDPMRREVELEFLSRMLAAAQDNRIAMLAKAEGNNSVEVDLAAMQSLIFQELVRLLQRSVSQDAGFGRLRD